MHDFLVPHALYALENSFHNNPNLIQSKTSIFFFHDFIQIFAFQQLQNDVNGVVGFIDSL